MEERVESVISNTVDICTIFTVSLSMRLQYEPSLLGSNTVLHAAYHGLVIGQQGGR
jgi:hypothetical protein